MYTTNIFISFFFWALVKTPEPIGSMSCFRVSFSILLNSCFDVLTGETFSFLRCFSKISVVDFRSVELFFGGRPRFFASFFASNLGLHFPFGLPGLLFPIACSSSIFGIWTSRQLPRHDWSLSHAYLSSPASLLSWLIRNTDLDRTRRHTLR